MPSSPNPGADCRADRTRTERDDVRRAVSAWSRGSLSLCARAASRPPATTSGSRRAEPADATRRHVTRTFFRTPTSVHLGPLYGVQGMVTLPSGPHLTCSVICPTCVGFQTVTPSGTKERACTVRMPCSHAMYCHAPMPHRAHATCYVPCHATYCHVPKPARLRDEISDGRHQREERERR